MIVEFVLSILYYSFDGAGNSSDGFSKLDAPTYCPLSANTCSETTDDPPTDTSLWGETIPNHTNSDMIAVKMG